MRNNIFARGLLHGDTTPFRIFTRLLMAAALGLIVLLAGCQLTRSAAPTDPKAMAPAIQFSIEAGLGTDGENRLNLTVENTGSRPFPGDESFNGVMEILDTGQDEVRGRAEIKELPPLEPGEKQTVLKWQGKLDSGTYQVTWGGPGYEGSLIQFQTP